MACFVRRGQPTTGRCRGASTVVFDTSKHCACRARHTRNRLRRSPAWSCNGAVAGCFASGAKALHTVSCQTVVKLQKPEDLQYVLMANDLVAETFYNPSDNPVFDAVSFNSYRVRSAAQTVGLHMAPSRSHATIVALTDSAAPAAAAAAVAAQQQQQAYQQQSWQQQAGQEQRAVGVVNVTLMQASDTISAAASCKRGTPFAMITNMAVLPDMRRRGIAHKLMQAAISASLLELDYSPAFALLLAYKYYEPAVRLYESWGFEGTPWEDPLWVADAEKGKMGRQRRIMMVKQLSGRGLMVSPLGSSAGIA